jgi:RimJ/RimL family protein N-acetyltransferase
MPFPIQTARLSIQPFTLDDAEGILPVWSDPVAMRWIPSGTITTVDAAREKIGRFMAHHAAHGFSLWPVRDKATGRILGDCGLILVEWKGPEVELAYRFGQDSWGKGIATEAAAACLRYGFETSGLDEIIAVTAPEHRGSRRVMEKIELQFVGTATYFGRELVKYAITRDAWLQASGAGPERPS